MKRILVVEDEFEIQEMLDAFLSDAGYQVEVAGDGIEGLCAFKRQHFDLILLDIMMPKIDGYGVCELIRKESDVPIVMLTALDSEAAQLKGYELLVDEYIMKPFSVPILIKKIEAVLRRQKKSENGAQIQYKQTVLDQESYRLYEGGEEITVTTREFEILKMLLMNQGRVMTRQIFIDQIWPFDFDGDDRVVDTHIKNIRKKMNVDYIETIRGVGYLIAKEN